MKKNKLIPILCFSLLLSSPSLFAQAYLLEIDGIINPVVSGYISEELKAIPEGKTVIIRMNTPGGLMDSMMEIIQSMLNSAHPVIMWIGPSGCRAASAGVFITMASDIACMAPGTNIGAAHPVQMGGGGIPGQAEKVSEDKEMTKKITNDAAAYMRSITKEKNRNVKWAQEAVTKSVSITSDEALKNKVIEYIFSSLDDLRAKLDGKKIKKLNKEFIVRTKGGELIKKEMKPFKKFLNNLAHPNIAFILLMIGIYGLIYEFASPGIGLGAIIAAIFLILAFFSLQLLPVNYAGLLLLIMGIVLMTIDMFHFTIILTVGGVLSFVVGALMLFDFSGKFISISVSLVLTVAIVSALFFLFVLGAIVKAHRNKITTGKEGLIGVKGHAETDFDSSSLSGMVLVEGELWKAELAEKMEIKKGDKIQVVEVEGNLLKVKKI